MLHYTTYSKSNVDSWGCFCERGNNFKFVLIMNDHGFSCIIFYHGHLN